MLDNIYNRFGKIFRAEIPVFGAFDTVFGIVKKWEPILKGFGVTGLQSWTSFAKTWCPIS